ncbi:uncharacterized protein TOT_020000398 [Theileria orientalis strain Shintoku]|uniref:Uncharacterized protein n=1 Tax=Theileria orientalis strain Shintoku TaxID=869250 RepID=J4D7E5_THEOR|nr:uncharacterized protein TOT_020000398 [Theileria orientalis strain Shintoku]BAM40135.1 uncharacterized protein TOT_020000398 [Theileria orientalis strain Shintoku]|eukprot:XP_009690436.1 uncharacterized protein TOT_020000398 [Theileria orientalis strain Shintoku]
METGSHSTDDSSTNNMWYNSWLYSILSTNDKQGSLQLLSADFYSYALLKRFKNLKETALGISRSSINVNPERIKNLINLSKQQLRGVKSNHSQRDYKKDYFESSDYNEPCVTRPSGNRHKFLEGMLQMDPGRCTEAKYSWVFHEFENYVIKLFSIHPTLWSGRRGVFMEDDGAAVNSCLNYVRFYESAMHLLSQKLHHHFYLTVFLLIVLLRNARRLLHHYKTNATFFELTLIMVEGIQLCQNHLYNAFLSDERIFRSPLHEDNYYRVEHEESIKSHNDECNNCKNQISNICKDEKLKLEVDASREGSTVGDEDGSAGPEDSCRSERSALGGYGDFIGAHESTYPRMTKRESHFGPSLDYDKSEIFHLQYLNVVLDCEVAKWIAELCKLARVYCKMGKGPVLLERKYTKLVPDPKGSVIPSLCTAQFTNLSAHRKVKENRATRYKKKRQVQNQEHKKHGLLYHLSSHRHHEEILSRIQSISESISRSLSQSQSASQTSRSSLSQSMLESPNLSQSHSQIRDQTPRELISQSKDLMERFEFSDDPGSSASSDQVTPQSRSVSQGKAAKTASPAKVKEKDPPKPKKRSGKPEVKPKKSKYQKWNLEEVELFIKALNTYGDGKWRHIEQMYFLGKKSQAQLKDKWVNLVKFGHIKKVDIIRENGTIGRIWVPVESPGITDFKAK